MTKKPKLISSIRAKLVSAVAMLLVAMIMVVSSTYAWFTLSTAPEVTGISTQIGANGALEMALLPSDGVSEIKSSAGDGSLGNYLRNLTWGNLVNLDDAAYGLDQITLYPSRLNLNEGNKTLNISPLGIPEYGSDGRVSAINTGKTVIGVLEEGAEAFYQNDLFGVRGVGTASGMTPRQLNYRNAKAKGGTLKDNAKTIASTALNANGSALANIAIEHGLAGESATDAYDETDVAALRALITGTENALASIEEAYMYYIAAYVASATAQTAGVTDEQAKAIYDTVTTDGKTLDDITTLLTSNNVTLDATVSAAIAKLNATKDQVTAADTALATLETELASNASATFTWEQISDAMNPLANPEQMVINGIKASAVKENMGELVGSVTSQGGLKVTMESGAGVFADIADHCGDFSASVNIEEVAYNDLVIKNTTARMETKTTVTPQYLTGVGTAVDTAGAPSGGSTVMPISDFYGYIIDLAFRTNAPDSNLLLQTEGTDRIYDGNNNESTMGHGSTMTFSTPDNNFGTDKIKDLMSNLRVVFFQPNFADDASDLGTILAYAKLDMSRSRLLAGENGETLVEAPLVLYKTETTYTYKTDDAGNYVTEDNNILYHYNTADGKYYDSAAFENVVEEANMTGRVVTSTTINEIILTGDEEDNKPVITAMTQNAVMAVSALVYLDGENLGNDDVSATVAQSLTGTMNLQFASSAPLDAMDYSDLYTPNGADENP